MTLCTYDVEHYLIVCHVGEDPSPLWYIYTYDVEHYLIVCCVGEDPADDIYVPMMLSAIW